ncbi:MAG: hypothetical protein RJA49_1109 [Actinomycetota bacterium]
MTGQPSPHDTVPLPGWDARGVRLVIDVTDDGSPFTRPHSAMRRVWLPTPDDGTPRDPRWFDGITRAAGDTESVLVHCHMGVARGPSAAFAIMLARGWHELDAIDAVMFGRPIATVLYAADALRWFLGSEPDEARLARLETRRAELLAVLRERIVGDA